MNLLALIWGIVTLCFAGLSFIPFFGWGNWFVIPCAVIGCIMGAIAKRKGGLWLNVIALIIAFFRLLFGGGIL